MQYLFVKIYCHSGREIGTAKKYKWWSYNSFIEPVVCKEAERTPGAPETEGIYGWIYAVCSMIFPSLTWMCSSFMLLSDVRFISGCSNTGRAKGWEIFGWITLFYKWWWRLVIIWIFENFATETTKMWCLHFTIWCPVHCTKWCLMVNICIVQ